MQTSTDRLARLRGHLVDILGLEWILVSSPNDVRWASGFSGSVASLVVGPARAVLFVDSRYGDQAREQAPHCEVVVVNAVDARHEAINRVLHGVAKVGFDDKRTTYADWRALHAALSCELVGVGDPLGDLRAIKDEHELARIESAARAADRALADVTPLVFGGGITERDVRDELEARMRKHGADGAAYPPIVASGPNSALPHHQPTERTIREGDSVIIDVGALVDGYRSDMTRTLFVGEVDPLLRAFHGLLSATQSEVVKAVCDGVAAARLDEMAREGLQEFAGDILHSTGHGVGLDIHESPWLRLSSAEVLSEGNVVTVEPGLYRVGVGGVRIEDLVLVERSGSRTLTNSPKDPSCPQSAPTT